MIIMNSIVLKLKDLLFPNMEKKFLKRYEKVRSHIGKIGLYHKTMYYISFYRYEKLSRKLLVRIPLNVVGDGLSLPHPEVIGINPATKIGKNCRIQRMVGIGPSFGTNNCPTIGDNVYIGPGARLYGDIEIADNCWIGANAVVNKSFLEPYSVIAGVPAKVVKIETRNWMDVFGNGK